ncbi:MAG: hypothetical protein L0216_00840 [Planctomycetales bacterium]|nr:hypothetical protein [Planctomycetales bacterium]
MRTRALRGVSLSALVGLFPSLPLSASADPAPSPAALSGCPKKDGLGKLAILTNLAEADPRWTAVRALQKHRKAAIVTFPGSQVREAATSLAQMGPEFVAIAVPPTTVDMNFQLDMLDLCRNLDPDPMPDFHFGYLCARDAADLEALVSRIVSRESEEGRVAQMVAAVPPGHHLQEPDFILHFGHGEPCSVVEGITGEQVGALSLPKKPVVFSGACFTAVLSRSYHPCAYQLIYLAPVEMPPEKLLSLNWVHAGVSGYLAALEGDRGEMATAEWERFREGAGRLGEVIGFQYRLAFTSLPAGFQFPRYQPGVRKAMSFYDVIMRGMISRILISDPMLCPLREPLDPPSSELEVTHDPRARTVTATVRVNRWSMGHFLNYLPKPPSDRFDRRLYQRIPIPAEATGKLGEPKIEVRHEGKAVTLTQHHVRHEVWGGARYANVQLESEDAAMVSPGAVATITFPAGR